MDEKKVKSSNLENEKRRKNSNSILFDIFDMLAYISVR